MDPNLDTGPEDQRQDPTRTNEENAHTFVEQLRSAPAEQILAEVFSTLLTAAEVKLGRRDARLFIDLCTTMLEEGGSSVSEELGETVERALGQLRLGQVGAENQSVNKGESEPNDLARAPTPATNARPEAPTDERTQSVVE